MGWGGGEVKHKEKIIYDPGCLLGEECVWLAGGDDVHFMGQILRCNSVEVSSLIVGKPFIRHSVAVRSFIRKS